MSTDAIELRVRTGDGEWFQLQLLQGDSVAPPEDLPDALDHWL